MSEYADRIIKLEKKEKALRNKYAAECNQVDELTEELESIDQKNVIKTKYIVGYTFEQTAQALNYSESYTYKLHRLAIKRLEIALKKIG